MKITFRLILLAAVLGAGVWLWLYFHPSPEETIRRRLTALARDVSFSEREGMIARAAHAQSLAGYFAPDLSLRIDLPELSSHESLSRDEITRLALALRSAPNFRSLKVQILDPVITLGANLQSADVELTLRAESAGDKYLVVQEMKFTLRKVDGEWLILRVETVKTLNRAPTRHRREAPAWA